MAAKKPAPKLTAHDMTTLMIRHGLAGLAVYGAAKGYIPAEGVEELVAAGSVLAAVGWSMWEKKKKQ
jgi:hypothetical protein